MGDAPFGLFLSMDQVLTQHQIRVALNNPDQPRFVSPLGDMQRDLVSAFLFEQIGYQVRILARHRQQHILWKEGGFGVIPLNDSLHQFWLRRLLDSTQIDMPSPNDLPVAHLEDCSTRGIGFPVDGQREEVAISQISGHHFLALRIFLQRCDLVAQFGRFLKIHGFGDTLHLILQQADEPFRFSIQELLHLFDGRGITLRCLQSHTRCITLLDVVLETDLVFAGRDRFGCQVQ